MIDFTFDNAIETLDLFLTYDKNTINLSGYNFIEPLGIAIIKSIALENPTIKKVRIDKHSPARTYITTLLYKDYDPSKSYLPVENIKTGRDIDKITSRMVAKIMEVKEFKELNETDKLDLSRYLTYMIGEILNNAIYHSGSRIGAVVAAQYFRSKEKLQVVVVDRGVGFLKNLQYRYAVETEREALLKALEKGVTSSPAMSSPYYSSISHAGYGLYTLFCILKHTEGRLLMISNDGAVLFDKGDLKKEKDKFSNKWKGSIVAFEFQEKNINFSMEDFFKIYIHTEEQEKPEASDLFFED